MSAYLWPPSTVPLEPVSPQNQATNGHFRPKTSWESHSFSPKKHAKPLEDCQKRDISDWNFCFFFFFSSVRDSFFAKNQLDATFLTLKKNHLTPGVEALIQYLTFGNNVNILFFMWCDVQRFPSARYPIWGRSLIKNFGHVRDMVDF